jgi:lysophospholipase L1-like esterase
MRRLLLAAPLFLILAACGSGSPPAESGALSGPGVYVALGDSLSEGVGASGRSAAFVPLVHEGLGEGFELMNLGHSGDTSSDLLDHGHVEQAAAEVSQRNGDDDPDNDVKFVTLEIGGNDLLHLASSLVLTGVCPNLERSLDRPECLDPVQDTLDDLARNLATALDSLQEADPDLTIAVMTLYNPFSGRVESITDLAEVALEGQADGPLPEGLNDIVRGEAAERALILVDWHPLFEGKANEYISRDLIHPNDAGYEVMAEAVLAAVR